MINKNIAKLAALLIITCTSVFAWSVLPHVPDQDTPPSAWENIPNDWVSQVYEGHSTLTYSQPGINSQNRAAAPTSPPAVSDTGVIYIAVGNQVYAYSPLGAVLEGWPVTMSANVVNRVALSPDHKVIYAGTVDGELHAVHSADSTKSAQPHWQLNISSPGHALSPPLVDQYGFIYLGSTNALFYSVDPNGSIRWSFNATTAIAEEAVIYGDYTLTFSSVDGNSHTIRAGVLGPSVLRWNSQDDSLLKDYLGRVDPDYANYHATGWDGIEMLQVGRLFEGLLMRRPDRESLRFWTYALLPQTGASLEEVAKAFLQSDSAERLYGTLDDAQFVQALYRNVLRQADYASEPEYAQRIADLKAGRTSRALTVLLFTNSQQLSARVDQSLLSTIEVFFKFCYRTDCEFLLDTDNDGLADQWEIAQFGDITSQCGTSSDQCHAYDADRDGVSNYDEFLAGTEAVARIDPPLAPAQVQAPDVSSSEVIESDKIGITGGQFRVDEQGAATYRIPVLTPAGTAGVAPDIELYYSSQGGNGVMGSGWSIGGLSSISRCRQTPHRDGQAKPITWTDQDRFCLDGKRLVNVSGEYGARGSTYKTEIDTWVTVTAHGSGPGHPDYFTVVGKDGSISYYGNSPNSKNRMGPHVMSWAINRFEDNVGNPITYKYLAAGGMRIDEIAWAYGHSATANARVEFHYKDGRPDSLQGYVGGYASKLNQRLANIEVYATGVEMRNPGVEQKLREYEISYLSEDGANGSLSRVNNIRECAFNTSSDRVCLQPTQFTWSGIEPITFETTASTQIELSPLNDRGLIDQVMADINGDGIQDIVWLQYDRDGNFTDQQLQYALSTPDGTLTRGLFGGTKHEIEFGEEAGLEEVRIAAIDYNADGRQDLMVYNQFSGKWKVYLAYLSGNKTWQLSLDPITTSIPGHEPETQFLDVNGDGLTDAVYVRGNGGNQLYTQLLEVDQSQAISSHRYYHFGEAKRIAQLREHPFGFGFAVDKIAGNMDLNADGLADVNVIRHASKTEPLNSLTYTEGITLNSDITGDIHYEYIEDINSPAPGSPFNMQGVDFNADGLTDLLYQYRVGPDRGKTWYYRINTGDGFLPEVEVAYEKKVYPVDYNGDGHMDLYWTKPLAHSLVLQVRLWNPASQSFDAAIYVNDVKVLRDQAQQFADFNGDGVVDYLRVFGDTLEVFSGKRGNDIPAGITHITTGLGAQTRITYKPLSTGGHYRRVDLQAVEQCDQNIPYQWYRYCVQQLNEFYSSLNGNWDLPADSDTFGKTAPVLEFAGSIAVVTRVQSSAPRAHVTPGAVDNEAMSAVSYYYGEAKMQASGQGFLGFHSLRTVDEQTGIETLTTYRQDYPFVGYPLSTQVRTADKQLLSRSDNTWTLHNWNGRQTPLPYRPYIARSVETNWQTRSTANTVLQVSDLVEKTVRTDSVYDEHGNPKSITVVTLDELGLTASQTQTKNWYDGPDILLHDRHFTASELGRISRTQVTKNTSQGEYSKASTFTYLGNGLLETEVIDPDDPVMRLTKTYTYDLHGNVTKSVSTTPGLPSRDDKMTYDHSGRFVVYQHNVYGQTTSTVLSRNALGGPLRVADINGVESTAVYGAFGTKLFGYSLTGAWSSILSSYCNSLCPDTAVFKTVTRVAGGGGSIKYFDKLAREVRRATRQFDSSWAYTDTEYDASGRVKRKSEPDNQGLNGDITPPHWTQLTYDVLGRPVSTELPGITDSVTVAYDGLKTVATNPLQQTKTKTRNALGQLLEVVDDIGAKITYTYTPGGKLSNTTNHSNGDAAASEIHICYDQNGLKMAMRDPDKGGDVAGASTACPSGNTQAVAGWWLYQYNGFGELIQQIDANAQRSKIGYDRLGRMTSRVDHRSNGSIEASIRWTYHNTNIGDGRGALVEVQDTVSGYTKQIHHDSLGRAVRTVTQIGAEDVHYENITFDQFGREFQVFDAGDDDSKTASVTQNFYNNYGYLSHVADGRVVNNLRTVYYYVKATNLRGQISESLNGNGVTSYHNYDPVTGRLDSITSQLAASFDKIQAHHYTWDDLGNLLTRHSDRPDKQLEETFRYDDLNRLVHSQVKGRSAQTIEYNSIGNITFKSDVGRYHYGSDCSNGGFGPHAVCQTSDGVRYEYDANGNMTHDSSERQIGYTTFDKPSVIQKGGHTTRFQYGPDRGRYLRTDTDINSNTTVTRYIGRVEKLTHPDGRQQIKRYLPGGALITLEGTTANTSSSQSVQYIYKDHLGSVDVITNTVGRVVQTLSFDAWGQRRQATDWSPQQDMFASLFTTRGYTGHEMLDQVGLIHMNGRIYDARLGRFLQADPFVDGTNNTQGYNRYAYVSNNPLAYTDPSGHFKLRRWVGAIVGLIGGLICNAACAQFGWQVVAVGTASGAAGAAANGGNILKGAVIGGVSAAAFSAIGQHFNKLSVENLQGVALGTVDKNLLHEFAGNSLTSGQIAQQISMHTIAGGVLAVVQGGKFGHGFVSAGITKGVMGAAGFDYENNKPSAIVGRTLVAAMVGGTTSRLTGGKFANGAQTAAMAHLLNSEASAALRRTIAQKGTVKFNYKTKGLEKFQQAQEKYGVTALFEDMLPAGEHAIDVSIDASLSGSDVGMQNPSAGVIKVNPDFLENQSLDIIGSAIGHELVHVNDHLRGNLDVYDRANVNASERRAYQWNRRNARHFGLGVQYKIWATQKINEHW